MAGKVSMLRRNRRSRACSERGSSLLEKIILIVCLAFVAIGALGASGIGIQEMWCALHVGWEGDDPRLVYQGMYFLPTGTGGQYQCHKDAAGWTGEFFWP